MADFRPFDLGQVLQTAEAIKAVRSQATTDRLREKYMGEQIQSMQDTRARQQRMDEVTFGKERAQQEYTRAGYILESQNPKNLIETQFPDIQQIITKSGADWATLNDDQIKEVAKRIQAKAGSEIGVGPARPDPKLELERQKLAQNQSQFDQRLSLDRQKLAQESSKSQAQYRSLSADELQQYNLPPGTSAQVNEQTGKLSVISKRDNTASLSQKDATTAKMKLNTVQLARQQLAAIRKSFTEGTQGFNAFGPGQGLLPTQAGKKFDAAVDQMRSTLTALTRVPGVGAMSDYETRLDQAKFPSRGDYEDVTAQKIQGIDDMLNAIERGYTDLLSGGQGGEPQQQAQPRVFKHPSGATIEIIE